MSTLRTPKSAAAGDADGLLARVHKLHGATRYVGTPALRAAVAAMETALKLGTTDTAALAAADARLQGEMTRVAQWLEQTLDRLETLLPG